MEGLMTFIHNYKVVDGFIVLLGVMAVAIIAERMKALFRDLHTTSDFYPKVMELMAKKEVTQASALCATQKGKPLPEMLKRLIDNSHLNPDEIEKTYFTAMSELTPHLTRRLGYLSMIANVVTMVGLLGTVMGLIVSFQAVSMADPAQKQTLLAQGISMAMHATALGLLVAIPVMVVYAFLAEKQMRLMGQLEHLGQEMLEYLRAQDRIDWGAERIYPVSTSTPSAVTENAPPPPRHLRVA